MKKTRALISGESWIEYRMHVKGFDTMTTASYEVTVGWLQGALENADIEVEFMPDHLASAGFPMSMEALKAYDVIILSDVGANTLLLHPDTALRSRTTPNRLDLLHDYVQDGGGLMMIGGWLSFTGVEGKANFRGTGVEKALPVTMLPTDDRVEMPQGFQPEVLEPDHPVLRGIQDPWPVLLGYNRVEAKPGAAVLLKYNEDPIAVAWEYGNGRAAVFTSDCAPHWGTPEYLNWQGYRVFFSQMVLWLNHAL